MVNIGFKLGMMLTRWIGHPGPRSGATIVLAAGSQVGLRRSAGPDARDADRAEEPWSTLRHQMTLGFTSSGSSSIGSQNREYGRISRIVDERRE
jgi:hypothetical protein